MLVLILTYLMWLLQHDRFFLFSDGQLHVHAWGLRYSASCGVCETPAAKRFGFDRISEAHRYFLSTLVQIKACYPLLRGRLHIMRKGLAFISICWEDYPLLWWEVSFFSLPSFYFCCDYLHQIWNVQWSGPVDLAHTQANPRRALTHVGGKNALFFDSAFHDWHLRLRGPFLSINFNPGARAVNTPLGVWMCSLTQHPTSTHRPPQRCGILCRAKSSHPKQLLAPPLSSHPKAGKGGKRESLPLTGIRLHTLLTQPRMTSRSCSAAPCVKGVSRTPLMQTVCPLATWVCSAPDIMAWQRIRLDRAVITQMDVDVRGG